MLACQVRGFKYPSPGGDVSVTTPLPHPSYPLFIHGLIKTLSCIPSQLRNKYTVTFSSPTCLRALQTDDARANKRSLNPYCVILFDGVEVGRTRTIPDSTDPLWETTFHLSDELLQKRSLLKRRSRVNRSGERSGETAESDDPRFVTPREVVDCSVDLEIWDRAAQGQPVLIGAAEIPTELMSELLVCDDITASDGPVEDQCSVAASYCQREKGMHLLKLGLRSGEDRCDTSQSGGSNFAAPADIAVAGRLETSALGTLSVSVRRVRTAAVKVTGTAGGVVAWSPEERNKALGEEKDNKLCADLKAVDSGRLDSTATSKVCVCVCIYVIAHNRAAQPCHTYLPMLQV